MANYYEILQVPTNATIDQIKAAFRRLARQYHPDLNREDPTAGEKFRAIERAYEVLRDPAQRQQYDRDNLPAGEKSPSVTRNARGLYEQGLGYAKRGEYARAIDAYNRAIELDPKARAVYLARAEAHYSLGQDRSVLEDCRLVLQEDSNCSETYYYLGLARQRLGYTQSAIDAYNRALALDPQAARVYYQRGVAREELAEHREALQDWQRAIEEYQKAGDFSRYRSLQKRIKILRNNIANQHKKGFLSRIQSVPSLVTGTVKTFGISVIDPRSGLTAVFWKSGRERALGMGIMAGVIGGLCLALSWQNRGVGLAIESLWLFGIVPFLLVSYSCYFVRNLGNFYGHTAGDFFLGGFTLLPVSLAFWLTSAVNLNEEAIAFMIGATGMYSAWIGYNCLTGLGNFSPKIALGFLALVGIAIASVIWGVYYSF
jgi:curved DNA-binding protein CbpA